MYQHHEGLTRLIYRPTDQMRLSPRRECGASEAAARGFKEYLEQLSIDAPSGGRRLSFVTVETTFGDLWTPTHCPAANVHGGVGDAEYTAAKTSGTPVECDATDKEITYGHDAYGQNLPPNYRRAWFSPSTFEADFNLEVWAQDKGQRSLLELMLEDDFNPTPDWLSGGVRLELPHYCNARADFHIAGSSIAYEGRQAQQNRYVLKYAVKVTLDLRVGKSLPKTIPVIVENVNKKKKKVPV
mgnify:FL=1